MHYFLVFILALPGTIWAQKQQKSDLELREIMKGKDFIGYWPENHTWSVSGNEILFDWNPENELVTSRYIYDLATKKINKSEPKDFIDRLEFDSKQKDFTQQYFLNRGDLWVYDKVKNEAFERISSAQYIESIQRMNSPEIIAFRQGNNLFEYNAKLGTIKQLTNFQKGEEKVEKPISDILKDQQTQLFQFIREENETATLQEKADNLDRKKPMYLGKNQIDFMVLSANGDYVYIGLGEYFENKKTSVENHVTTSGYSEIQSARPKVGENEPFHQFAIYDRQKDTLRFFSMDQLPDIRKKPTYLKEYDDVNLEYTENRKVVFHEPIQSSEGIAVMDIRSYDNKDRWIVEIHAKDNELKVIDKQHDEAWIGGPGISSWNRSKGVLDFFEKGKKIYFQSEEDGFSHLYSYDLEKGKKKQLTKGNFEIHDVQLLRDDFTFLLTTNVNHPGDRSLYKLNSKNNSFVPVLNERGAYSTVVSPNEKYLTFLYSDKINPWELFIRENKSNANSEQLTYSQSKDYKSYKWRNPEVVAIQTEDETPLYARIYAANKETKNNAAIVFVHGAGYLQNAHNYWSVYYREFMFHQMLSDYGYTIIDIDFRASEGYGRDHRTAIYRHMGNQDLADQIIGKNYLVKHHQVDSNRVGIYGGSYGGFITLMALLTRPNEFACGAALRSVTDWMHYNHEYTSNILNYPSTDSIAYARSSPINFAQNLTKPLLMLHGMIDENVQFQDVVRLSQRFIELEKTNWNLTAYPIEAHGFKKATSWLDEYRRILELMNSSLLFKE